MADGDIIHGQPNGYYRTPYERFCEGKSNLKMFAWELMGALLKDIKRQGNELISLAKYMGEYIKSELSKEQKNWSSLNLELEKIKDNNRGSYYAKEIVFRAAQKILHDLKYGEIVDTNNLPVIMVKQYMKELFQSKFEARIDPNYEQHSEANIQELYENIQDTQDYCSRTIERWSNQVTKHGDLGKLRRSPRPKEKSIDLNEDLL